MSEGDQPELLHDPHRVVLASVCHPFAAYKEALRIVRRKNSVTEQVLRAPQSHLRNDRQQALAHSSQGVLYLWRHDLVFGPLDEPKGGQGLSVLLDWPFCQEGLSCIRNREAKDDHLLSPGCSHVTRYPKR